MKFTELEALFSKILIKNTKSIKINKKSLIFNKDSINKREILTPSLNFLPIIANSHLNLKLAIQELETLFEIQDKSGFLPFSIKLENLVKLSEVNRTRSCIFEGSEIITPPILGLCVKKILQKSYNLNFLERIISGVKRYYDFLLRSRILENDVLLFTSNYRENIALTSGLLEISNDFLEKSSTIFSKSTSYLFSLLFNVFFVQGLRDLSLLFSKLNNKSLSEFYSSYATKMETHLLSYFWNEDELFFSELLDNQGARNKVKTIVSLIPLYLDNLPHNIAYNLVEEQLLNENKFKSNYPVPFFPLDEFNKVNHHQSNFTSTVFNWLIILGLHKHGFFTLSQELFESTIKLISKYGFREYYDPVTGNGFGKKNPTHSTVIIDLINIFIENEDASNFIFDREWTRIKRLPDF